MHNSPSPLPENQLPVPVHCRAFLLPRLVQRRPAAQNIFAQGKSRRKHFVETCNFLEIFFFRSRGPCNLKHSSKATHKCATQSRGYRNSKNQILVSPGLTKRRTPSLNHFHLSKTTQNHYLTGKLVRVGRAKQFTFPLVYAAPLYHHYCTYTGFLQAVRHRLHCKVTKPDGRQVHLGPDFVF